MDSPTGNNFSSASLSQIEAGSRSNSLHTQPLSTPAFPPISQPTTQSKHLQQDVDSTTPTYSTPFIHRRRITDHQLNYTSISDPRFKAFIDVLFQGAWDWDKNIEALAREYLSDAAHQHQRDSLQFNVKWGCVSKHTITWPLVQIIELFKAIKQFFDSK